MIRLSPAAGAEIVGEKLDGTAPTWVFLHGRNSARRGEKSEALFARARTRGAAAFRFDFRGHGESSGDPTRVTLTELIEDADCVLRHCGRSVLVGSSMGGLVACWAASRNPGAVAALILLAPALGFLARLEHAPRANGLIVVDSDWTRIELRPEVVEDAARYDETALARLLTMPVFIAHGELDQTVPYGVSSALFAGIPHDNKELWVVPNGDHRLADAVDEILARAESFVAK